MAQRRARKRHPSFERERALGAPGVVIAGIDEVGRGPLAGPVVAAAVVLDPDRLPRRLVRQINDSKLVEAKLREAIFGEVQERIEFGIGQASVCEIDEFNIFQASLLAMQRAAAALPRPPAGAIIDGRFAPDLPCRCEAVVGGDGLSLSVALASIIAKVTRDRIMRELDTRYPGYGWAQNAGYATAEHRAAILDMGVTPEHRTSFRFVSEVLMIRG